MNRKDILWHVATIACIVVAVIARHNGWNDLRLAAVAAGFACIAVGLIKVTVKKN